MGRGFHPTEGFISSAGLCTVLVLAGVQVGPFSGESVGMREMPDSTRAVTDPSLKSDFCYLGAFLIRKSDVWNVPGFCKKGSEAALLSKG